MAHQKTSSSKIVWSANDLAENPHEAADKADRVEKMFAAIAHRYDFNNRVHSLWRDQAWRRKAVELCNVNPSDDVLDVACGTGDLSEAFAEGGARSVVGLDFTANMLEIAKHKARKKKGRKVVPSYIQGDAMELPFEDANFNIVSIAFGIRNVTNPSKALAEFKRVLKPGGRLIILEFSQPRNSVLRFFNKLYCNHIMPISATLISGDRSGAYRYLPKSVATFADRNELASMMSDAGFTEIKQHEMTFGVCTGSLGLVQD